MYMYVVHVREGPPLPGGPRCESRAAHTRRGSESGQTHAKIVQGHGVSKARLYTHSLASRSLEGQAVAKKVEFS